MENLKKAWMAMKLWQKLLSVTGMICSVTVVVLASLQLAGIWKDAAWVYEPLLGVLMLIQAVENWKTRRGLAIFSLCVAIFMFACAALVFLAR